MSVFTALKTKPTLLQSQSESWEESYPNEYPTWLNVIGWLFVFVPFFFH